MRVEANYESEALDPENPEGPKTVILIPAALYKRYYKYNPVKYENLRAVKYVLENTDRIFWGIREHSDGGWCYVGKPDNWTIKPKCQVPFPDDKVFALYVNPSKCLFEYGAEAADTEDPLSHYEWKERFRGRTWPRTF